MKESCVDVIIIRGAPGVGKSTAAKKLAEYFPGGARLEVDTLRAMVISADWKNQNEHINLLYLSTKVVSEFLTLGFGPVIVIDTFSGNKIEKFMEDLQQIRKEMKVAIIGLHCSQEELRKRIEERDQEEFRDFEISCKLNRVTTKRQYVGELQIDTTGISADETASIVYENIIKRKPEYGGLQFLP